MEARWHGGNRPGFRGSFRSFNVISDRLELRCSLAYYEQLSKLKEL